MEPKFDIKCAMTKWDDKIFMCNWVCNHGVNIQWWIQIVPINPRSQTFTCIYLHIWKLGFSSYAIYQNLATMFSYLKNVPKCGFRMCDNRLATLID
jgi:hypothetical protein